MNKYSLNFKISLVLLTALIGSVTISGIGVFSMNKMNLALTSLNQNDVPHLKNMMRAQSEFRLLALTQSNFIHEKTAQGRDEVGKRYMAFSAEFRDHSKEASEVASPIGKEVWKKVSQMFEKWDELAIEGQKAASADRFEEALNFLKQQSSIRKEAEAEMTALIDRDIQKLNQSVQFGDQSFHTSKLLIYMVSAISILLSCLIAFFVLRATSKSMNAVIESLSQGSEEVSSAAQKLAASSESISQAAVEQAASLEETAASIEEMNSMVNKTSDNANSTASTSSISQQKAASGKVVVEKMIQSMDRINESNTTIMNQMNRSNDQIAEIVKVIEEIGTKTKVINDIVFQTKLLSFNASVEAARAGEHGKGFAVVAEEVGNLAQMSGNAAKEISALLDGSIQKVNSIVSETKTRVQTLVSEGKVTVDDGSRVARECGNVLEEIVQNVSSVSTMASEIASASDEQARGVAEITKAMSQLDQVTQQNSMTSLECATAADGLSHQSQALKGAVAELVMVIRGGNSSTKPRKEVKMPAPVRRAIPDRKNVIPIQSAKKAVPQVAPKSFQKAVGGLPSHDDAGFEDV